MTDKDFTKIPIDIATQPFEGAVVYMDRYWIVQDGCILLYKKYSPQCNKDERVVERSLKKLYPGSEVKFLKTVYLDMLPALMGE